MEKVDFKDGSGIYLVKYDYGEEGMSYFVEPVSTVAVRAYNEEHAEEYVKTCDFIDYIHHIVSCKELDNQEAARFKVSN